jgi:hypothetical protein
LASFCISGERAFIGHATHSWQHFSGNRINRIGFVPHFARRSPFTPE